MLNSSTLRHQLTILALFTGLTFGLLYPLSTHLLTMVPEPTDPLLNAWRMHWNGRAFLRGIDGLSNIFHTNIFYPYPLTLVYSEHFLLLAAQALPFLWLTDSHLLGLNLSIILSFILSGYGMYLLVTAWTGNRWAGLIAGLLFAFSPYRFGQLNHLELLITQWMPLSLLALHWTLTRPAIRYPILLTIFLSLQALSGFHFFFNLLIACLLLTLVYALSGRIVWRRGLWLSGLLAAGVIFVTNWPIWRMYLRFSETMGAVRTPGEVRIYSAALTDYLTTIPHHWLYGWTFGYWQTADHQFQPLMPVGVTGLLLACMAIGFMIYDLRFGVWDLRVKVIFLGLLLGVTLLLSFGLNENALGPGLSWLMDYSPYPWLYEQVILFQAIRVPARFGIMVVVSLSILAGFGLAMSHRWLTGWLKMAWPIGLSLVMVIELWSVPLIGPTFPTGADIPPVYHWLRTNTPPDSVILELPHHDASEFAYEYYATYHWRRLANGGTGYTPPVYKDLRRWFNAFPDARAVDLMHQLGIDYLLLHQTAYSPADWQQLQADLPRYLPAITSIKHLEDTLIMQLAEPTCQTDPLAVQVTFELGRNLDGLTDTLTINYHNHGPAAFRGRVADVSQLYFNNASPVDFTEPLLTPAGDRQTIIRPIEPTAQFSGAWFASLDRTVPAAGESPPETAYNSQLLKPLGLPFADGPQLVAYNFQTPRPIPCSQLVVALQWQDTRPDDRLISQLLDPFGRLVIEQSRLFGEETDFLVTLPLVGSLPAGRYGLRVRVQTADGQERWPMTEEGVTIPPDQLPPLPLVIQPPPLPADPPLATEPVTFGESLQLLGHQVEQTTLSPGDWLRFTLFWQTNQPMETDYTVFSQLLDSSGQLWGQFDNQPRGGWYATSLWQPGQPLADDYAFPLQPGAPPGDYRLIVGWYDQQTQHRLPVETPAGTISDFVEIGRIRVE